MKLLIRNRTEFEYLPYEGLVEGVDEDGLYTGIPEPKYGEPVSYKGNISSPSGSVAQAFDGLEVRYSHVLLMDNPNVSISEAGKVRWKGKTYQITAVRPSINVLSVALLQETIDNGDQWADPDTPGGDDQPDGPEGETGEENTPQDPDVPTDDGEQPDAYEGG